LKKGSGFGEWSVRARACADLELIENVAASDASAIITGESGTGRSLPQKPFINWYARKGPLSSAAAIPESLIESEVFGHERIVHGSHCHTRRLF
jgi:DNA-binding NtrC family response regulator